MEFCVFQNSSSLDTPDESANEESSNAGSSTIEYQPIPPVVPPSSAPKKPIAIDLRAGPSMVSSSDDSSMLAALEKQYGLQNEPKKKKKTPTKLPKPEPVPEIVQEEAKVEELVETPAVDPLPPPPPVFKRSRNRRKQTEEMLAALATPETSKVYSDNEYAKMKKKYSGDLSHRLAVCELCENSGLREIWPGSKRFCSRQCAKRFSRNCQTKMQKEMRRENEKVRPRLKALEDGLDSVTSPGSDSLISAGGSVYDHPPGPIPTDISESASIQRASLIEAPVVTIQPSVNPQISLTPMAPPALPVPAPVTANPPPIAAPTVVASTSSLSTKPIVHSIATPNPHIDKNVVRGMVGKPISDWSVSFCVQIPISGSITPSHRFPKSPTSSLAYPPSTPPSPNSSSRTKSTASRLLSSLPRTSVPTWA